MAIQTDQLLQKLSPLSAIDVSGIGQNSLERERLKLMREQFEETKRKNREEMELAKLEEQGRLAREKMLSERAVQEQKAKAAATLKADKQDAYKKFGELNGQGDLEGARAMVPYMSSLGMGVDLEGEEAGLPRYRIEMDAGEATEAAQERAIQASRAGDQMGAAGLGYPMDDSGPMTEPAGIGSTEDAFAQALGASQHYADTGSPLRGPDAPDLTGGVPKNVIDMGAMQSQTLARLDPALSGLVGAYPAEYQDSASQTAGALRGLALPAKEAVKQFDALRGGPDSLIRSQIESRDQASAKAGQRETPSLVDREALFSRGFGYAQEAAGKFKMEDYIERRSTLKQGMEVLNNKDDSDDHMVGALVSRMMGERGATTEGDIARALGTAAMSFIDRIKSRLYKEAFGGLSLMQRNALMGILKKAEENDQAKAFDFLRNVDARLDSAETNSDVARGMRSYRDLVVPKDMRDEYEKSRPARASVDSGADPNEAMPMAGMEDVVIPETSRIAKAHNNPGNLKFVGQAGATQGEDAADGGSWASFASIEDGLGALREQVEKDAERGLSIREFVSKYAPPGSNDTEKYIKDAVRELRAQEGDLLSDVDAYDVVRFVARKESQTELPAQYSWEPDEEDPGAEAPADTTQFGPPAAAETPAQKRVRELLGKAGR